MKRQVLTVTLNPAVDRTIFIDGFKGGQTFYREKEVESAGGKGVNVSRALTKLGVKNLATGVLGGCSGKVTILRLLRKEGINQDFYRFGGYTRTNLTIYDGKASAPTRILEEGPRISEKQLKGFLSKFRQKLDKSALVVFSGRKANGTRDSIYADLIKQAYKKGVPTLLDTSGKALKAGLKAKPTIISPNKQEIEEALGYKLNSQLKIKSTLKNLHQMGIQNVFITLGKEGAVGYDGENMLQAKAPKLKCMNEVGCGDAFNAGIIDGYLKRKPFLEQLKSAVACGAASVLTTIPSAFSRPQYRKMLCQVRISNFF